MERDPSYSHYLLDGQLAAIDDYLEIRPENEERLRALAAAGRITVGPWYILMDEFLISGETIVGTSRRASDGAAPSAASWRWATCPTCSATWPRCPSSSPRPASTTPWSGGACPRSVDSTAFVWIAPDGSSVRAEYLVAGYGNGAALPEDAKQLVRRLAALRGGVRLVPAGRRSDAAHERLRPPAPPAVAGPGRGRGQRAPGRLRAPDLLVVGVPGRARHRRPGRVDGRTPLRLPVERADGRRFQPGGRQAGRLAGRAVARAAGGAADGAVRAGGAVGRRPSSTWPGP